MTTLMLLVIVLFEKFAAFLGIKPKTMVNMVLGAYGATMALSLAMFRGGEPARLSDALLTLSVGAAFILLILLNPGRPPTRNLVENPETERVTQWSDFNEQDGSDARRIG